MSIIKTHKFVLNVIHIYVLVLALFWIAGMVIGVLFAVNTSSVSAPLAVQFAQQKSSLLQSLMLQVVPLLAVWMLVRTKHFHWIYGIAFIKTFLFGYCSGSVCCGFSSAGWLVCSLMLFPQIITTVPFCWVAMKSLIREIDHHSIVWWLIVVVFTVIVVIDHLLVSPFLSSLF